MFGVNMFGVGKRRALNRKVRKENIAKAAKQRLSSLWLFFAFFAAFSLRNFAVKGFCLL
jgi:hypothetical protein